MNKKGATMVWAVISLLIIVILAGGLLTIGQASAKRSSNVNTSRQAYLTSRSAINVLLSQMDGYSVSGTSGSLDYDTSLFPQNVGDSVQINNFSFPDSMGECDAIITRTGDEEIKITATTTVGKSESTVSAYLNCTVTTQVIGSSTNVDSAFVGLNANTLNLNSKGDIVLGNGTDLYLSEIDRSGANRSTITVGGTLYTTINTTGGSLQGVRVTYGSLVSSFTPPSLIGNVTLPGTVNTLPASGHILLPYLSSGSSLSYVMAPNTTFPSTSLLSANGNGCYYIKVPAGCTLNLNLLAIIGNPKVYVFMDEQTDSAVSKVNLNYVSPNVNLYIMGGAGSTVEISDNVAVYGAISADNVTTSGDFYLRYVPSAIPDSTLSGSGGGTTIETQTWSFVRYDD